jgi:type II secretory pathway predicted ATPase ExeA
MKSRYEDAKNVFIDSVDVCDYVELGSSIVAYDRLKKSLDKPLKMILLFGKPGTGKSILLNRLYNELRYEKEIHYLEIPAADENYFLRCLVAPLTSESVSLDAKINFFGLVNYCKSIRGKREVIFLIDEAQMYNADVLEKIRLLSDTRAVKFVISLHKNEDEDLVAKKHFQTRIWEIIELKNASRDELGDYIRRKLLNRDLYEIANIIKDKEVRMLHKITQGNFRDCNKLLYSIFEISEYYDKHEPLKVNYQAMDPKIIEMAALKLGYINV